MIKKTTLAVIGLAASGFATAGTMGPVCNPANVTVPCEATAWDLGVQALYLKSVFDTGRAYRINTLLTNVEVQNDWDWGYRLEGSYHFNTGNDVTITWMHYQSDVNQGDFEGFIIAPQFLFTSPYTLSSDNEFDQINLVLGQHVDVSMVKKMRFYGGLQYAHIRANATNFYADISPFLPFTSARQFDNADYKGFGPVVGIDYAYNLTNELSLTANGSSSILYGTSRISNGYVGAPLNVVFAAQSGKKRAMVPSLEAKLGLNYAYNMAQGILNLEGGYQALNYFNGLQGIGVGFARPLTETDFGLYGPYFGVKYVGYA